MNQWMLHLLAIVSLPAYLKLIGFQNLQLKRDELLPSRWRSTQVNQQRQLQDIDSEDFKVKIDPQKPTTAWKESKPICDRIIESLLLESGSEFLSQPPKPSHEHYSEIMDDYIDLNVIQGRLKSGQYMNHFAFKQDVRNVFSKAIMYMGEDLRVLKAVENMKSRYKMMSAQLQSIPIKQFLSNGEHTSSFKNLLNVLEKYQNDLSDKLGNNKKPEQPVEDTKFETKMPPEVIIPKQPMFKTEQNEQPKPSYHDMTLPDKNKKDLAIWMSTNDFLNTQ